jgi:hypothetical protein
MRIRWSVFLLAAACSDPGAPELQSVLETNATSYVAVDDPDPRFDHAVQVILTLRNRSDLIVRLLRCSATISQWNYSVEGVGEGGAAWNPNYTCLAFGAPYVDLAPGQERTDTLMLRAPWQRSFNSQPIGKVEGEFFVVYETQICALVSGTGNCTPVNRIEFVPSNKFRITIP